MQRDIHSLLRQRVRDALTQPVPPHTRRDVHVPRVPGKVIAVIGPRRAGKTTFLWQVLAERLAAGIPREGLLLFGFEDERLAGMEAADLDVLIETYYRLHPERRGACRSTLLLDEIQLVPGWERFVRRLLDTENVEVFVSGSSAHMLSREVATSMRGRALEAVVLPFGFREFLRHRGEEPLEEDATWTSARRSAMNHALDTYLVSGGYPEAQAATTRDRAALLRSYVDVALLRDVIERHAVSQPTALRWMVRQLLGNAAGAFSVNRFHRDLTSQGIAVGKNTLHDMLAHLRDAFLVRVIEIEARSERRRMVNPRKCYPVDPALIPLFDRSGRANAGHALETCVLLELERRGAEVTYVRTRQGFEVDFLARDAVGGSALIQVCHTADAAATREREVRALLAASEEHPEARMQLVTTTPAALRGVPRGIEIREASAWLLGAPTRTVHDDAHA